MAMVLDIILWILVIASFVLAFAALIYPVLPGVPLLWLGALIYSLGISEGGLHFTFWIALSLFSIFMFAIDFISNRYFLKQTDVSDLSDKLSIPAIVIGSFVIPPFGLLIIPFITVMVVELYHEKSYKEAAKVAGSTVISFLASSAAKFIMLIMFVIIFCLYVFFGG
jgi:uncharacterized protein YqgC (DUF456 family)